ncbi:MAG TPA: hypothetical protein VE127_15235 [Solirubrobacteraceae bacterium]|nr:hypothetical protein [Solirubrobacteraceae bacterium]
MPEVDVPTAKELIEQIHEHVGTGQIADLVRGLEDKARALQELLLEPGIDADRVRRALQWTFAGRRRASAILGAREDAALAAWVTDLLTGADPAAERLARFSAATPGLRPAAAVEVGAELLHFTAPERHPLWSRWIWSEESRTGALALLIAEEFDLEAETVSEGYERVSAATRALHDSPEAAAFRLSGGGRLATDVMLACTYGVYMRTVLGLKMTQEFNALVPAMDELVRRLLGTHFHPREEVA